MRKNFDVIFVDITCSSLKVDGNRKSADYTVVFLLRRRCGNAVIFSVGRPDENVNVTDTSFQYRFNEFRIAAYQSPQTARVDFHGFWCTI